MFSSLKLWIAGIGAALVAALMLWAKTLQRQRDVARRARDVLLAGRTATRIKEKVIKEEEEKTKSRRAQLVREIKERKDEEFKGVDILSNPNDSLRGH